MDYYSNQITKLIEELSKLPGVGAKSAQRLAFHIINMPKEQVERLNMGAAKAEAKGINESLVIVDSLAFIVNVPNQTVITAMEQTETNENVFTNIDGAVII